MFDVVGKKIKEKLENKTIVVAVSTGVDSMVLLDFLQATLEQSQIIVAHVNHKQRLTSEKEAAFLQKYCQTHQIPIYLHELTKDYCDNFQAWARKQRYLFFEQVVKKHRASYLLTAHHNDDLTETMLMRLIRGTSLQGFCGIEEEQVINHEYTLYRPFLTISKQALYEYANAKKITYYEDESNEKDDYTRNRFRHHIIPLLKKENEKLNTTMYQYTKQIKELMLFIEQAVDQFIQEKVFIDEQIIKMKIIDFTNQAPFFQKTLLFRLLKKYQLSTVCVEEIIKQIKSSATRIVNDVNQEITMIKEYHDIIFIEKQKIPAPFYLQIKGDGEYNLGKDRHFIVDKNICYFKTLNGEICYNNKVVPALIRSRLEQDKIVINNQTKLLSDYLTNLKMPYLDRLQVLIACDVNNQPLYLLIDKEKKEQRSLTKNER